MSFSRNFFVVTFIGALFLSAAHAEGSDKELSGRIRINAGGSFGRSFMSASIAGLEVKGDSKGHLFAGPTANAEYLILDWLALGARYRGLFETAKQGEASIHDINGYAKFILPVLKEDDSSEFFLTIPAGFSLMNSGDKNSDALKGFNIGGLLGSSYFFTDYIGVQGEVGYVFRQVAGEEALFKNEKMAVNMHEFAVNGGVVFRF